MRIRLFPAAAGLFAVLAAGLLWLQLAGAAPSSAVPPHLIACASCHSMEQEVASWAQSPHQDVACLQCHTESDVAWIRHEFAEKNMEMADHPQLAPTIPLQVPNERCLDCHAPQMDYLLKDEAPPPLKAPAVLSDKPGTPMAINAMHDLHVNGEEAISCGACHFGSAHGPETTSTARVDAVHNACQSCHTEKQVTMAVTGSVSCGACHISVGSVTPKDHKNQIEWRVAHGTASTAGTCGECHFGPSAGPHGMLTSPAAYTSSTEDGCLACHGVAMPHPTGWMQGHTGEFRASSTTCANCHGTTGQGLYATYSGNPAAIANTGICKDCHLLPMPHPDSFMTVHGTESYKMPQVCDACHSARNVAAQPAVTQHASSSFCASCHDGYQHPTGWVANHGGKVTDSCAACHTVQGAPNQHNSCAACHTGSSAWHPKMWFASHGPVVEAQGEASCAKCHDYIQPSCAQCHRSR